MTTSLARLLDATRERLPSLRARRDEIERAAARRPAAPSWDAAFDGPDVQVIAEVKRRSPSAGSIAPQLVPSEHAAAYVRGGARAVSVLTEATHFGGAVADLEHAAATVAVPVLRKDFIIDPIQLHESRAAGAAAVLLIVRTLDPGQLRELAAEARRLGLGCLIEVHEERELEAALGCSPRTVGVNARDLDTFAVDRSAVERVLRAIPPDVVAVAESGIASRDDVERVAAWGADAVLVGTAVARAADPEAAVRSLTNVRRVSNGARASAASRGGAG